MAQDPQLNILTVSAPANAVYLDHASHSGRVMLKVVPVLLRHGKRTLSTYAVLDDGSEHAVILTAAVKHLGLRGEEESLKLKTIRQDVLHLQGMAVSFELSANTQTCANHSIRQAFTASELQLAEQSIPGDKLMKKYNHLKGIPLHTFNKVQPMLLIGSDHPHLITPIHPVRAGPMGAPVAVCTQLGRAVQGPTNFLQNPSSESSVLHLSIDAHCSDLHKDVQRLWQLDILPYRSEKEVMRSKQDQSAFTMLGERTTSETVNDITRYSTPLLRKKKVALPCTSPAAVMPLLCATEHRLATNPELAKVYNRDIHKLVEAGYAERITGEEARSSAESWYIPHHLLHHNGKARVVFNCSFRCLDAALNDDLLPGPSLGPSLLGVLLRFREHEEAISGDIRAMFHQIRLLPVDRPLLRFLWRDMDRDRPPDIFEWHVLPFGTVCSPCCVIYALQHHVRDHQGGNDDSMETVTNSFYVDNCLKSLCSPQQAKDLLDRLRALLTKGGFDIRQWASNRVEVISHLPTEARSTTSELWLTAEGADPKKSTLGLIRHCLTDTLGYKCQPASPKPPTMWDVYRVLASQYDPLGSSSVGHRTTVG